MKHAKRIGALICVIAICFTLVCAPSAHAVGALGGQAAGALVAAGLVALNIVAHTGAQALGSYFGWQSAPSSQSVLEYAFPNATSVISDYMNAATIKVDQGVTTIDGVVYDELWIEPGTFTNGLKTNLFDFKTKWAILSGQAGTLATGAGYLEGIGTPLYNVNGVIRSQSVSLGKDGGSALGINYTTIPYSTSASNQYWYYYENGNYRSPYSYVPPVDIYLRYRNNYGKVYSYITGRTSTSSQDKRSDYFGGGWNFIDEPFEYNYVSGVVPSEETDIPENYGLSIQIPHDKLETFYNTYPQYNVDNSVINIQQDQIDIDELTQAIFDMIESMEEIKAEWTDGQVEPEPEPEPEPPEPVEDVIEGLNVITQQQFEQMQQQEQLHQEQQQTQQQQLQEQQQISQNTSEINDTIKDVTATPDAEQLPDFKFDLRELFPFCIPFDIYRLLSSFDAEPQAPHVQLPIVIESFGFSYNLDLDFSAWDPVAQAMRTAELIVYAIGLAWATGKVIKW